jgi:hypothetical protein
VGGVKLRASKLYESNLFYCESLRSPHSQSFGVELGTAFAGMCTNGSRYGVQPVPIHGVRMPPLGHPALWESPTTPLAGTGPGVHP